MSNTIKMNKFLFLIILGSFLTSCSESLEEYKARQKQEFHESLEQFKQDSLSILKKKFDHFMTYNNSLPSLKLEDVNATVSHKNIAITVEDEFPSLDFNTLFVHQSYFTEDYNHPHPISTYEGLDNIRRLINGEAPILNEDESLNESLELLNEFKIYCSNFINAKYVLIYTGLDVVLPILSGDEYTMGHYKGIVCLFDFENKTPLDYFTFNAQNSTGFDAYDPNLQNAVVQNLLSQTGLAIYTEMNQRYSMTGRIPNQTVPEN